MSALWDTSNRDVFAYNFPDTTDINAKVRQVALLGENLDVDNNSTPETIWEVGGAYVFPAAAGPVSINSTSDADKDTTGSGVRKVLVQGLDANYLEQYETVSMNGSGVVTTINSYLRVNYFRSLLAGSSQVAEGTINAVISSNTVRRITASSAQDFSAVFTVPADHTFFPQTFIHSVLRSTTAALTITNKSFDPTSNSVFSKSFITVAGTQPSVVAPSGLTNIRVPEKTDYWIDATSASTTNIEASTFGLGLLVKNSFIPKYE